MAKDAFFNNEGNWNAIFGMGMEMESQVSELNWDNSMGQSDPFESALSSIVSSPVNSHPGIPNSGGENVVLKELIGRLGIVCNSGSNSTTTSCYNTPMNSPPKLNLSIMDHLQIHGNSIPRNHQLPPAPFPVDPGFLERAARFKTAEFPIPIPASDKKLDDSMEESSLSEQIPVGRKRKAVPKGKGKETQSSTLSAKDFKTVGEPEKEVSDAKRSKLDEEGNGIENKTKKEEGNEKERKENAKQAEAPKDYIHVRARRGQATDSHSLAERVRREKISERMKFLQDLVPGCNKVTGKAVMLDEIINYVQSLQKQVEFLSMKLATIDPRTDMNMEAVLSKDNRASILNTMNHLDALAQPFYVMAHDGPENPLTAMMHRGPTMTQIDGFGEASAAFWDNDLQSVVQTGFRKNQGPSFHGTTGAGQMKVEL